MLLRISLALILIGLSAGCVQQGESATELYARANATPFKFMYELNSSVGPLTLNFTISTDASISYTDCYNGAFGLDLTAQVSQHKAHCALISVRAVANEPIEGKCYCELFDWAGAVATPSGA